MAENKRDKGRDILEQLCGDPDGVAAFPQPFQDYTLEHLFGDVWTGDGMSLEEAQNAGLTAEYDERWESGRRIGSAAALLEAAYADLN